MSKHFSSALLLLVFGVLAVGSVDRRDAAPSSSSNSSSQATNESLASDVRSTAAGLFTSRYSSSWPNLGIRARPAGSDCEILWVKAAVELDDATVEAFHYGNIYAAYDGGVEHFFHERGFRGVVYEDVRGRRWRYGLISRQEMKALSPC